MKRIRRLWYRFRQWRKRRMFVRLKRRMLANPTPWTVVQPEGKAPWSVPEP